MANAFGESTTQMNGVQNIQEDYVPVFEVEEDEDCGRFLVAEQTIDQGQVILFEKPTGNGCKYHNYINTHV